MAFRPGNPPAADGDRQPAGAASPISRLSGLTGHAAPQPADGVASTATGEPARVGRLTHTEPSRLWPSDQAFATWLADNVDAVAEATSLDLRAAAVAPAGDVPVIVAEQREGAPAVIVCQRGASTDDAFGCLLRSMAASAARQGIWISADPGDEHMASVSWLNRAIDGRFMMLKVSAVQIGGSAAAPMFEIAVRPPRAGDPGVAAAQVSSPPPGRARRAEDWPSEPMLPTGHDDR
ncbi:MAG: hypothetical protein ACRDHD_07500 [Candidatus Limnocylindria bacterium]